MTTTAKTTHTPGPWHFDGERYIICGGGSCDWRATPGLVEEEDIANAHLLAAAPELLAALEAIVDPWKRGGDGWRSCFTESMFFEALDVIARATGKAT